jgi:hypothetical protein
VKVARCPAHPIAKPAGAIVWPPPAEVRIGARDYCRPCSEFLLRPVVVKPKAVAK